MNILYRPNYKEAGRVFGANIKEFASFLSSISDNDIELLNNGELKIKLGGELYEISDNLVEKRVNSKEGYNVSIDKNLVVILNMELSEDLINEGLARETISKIQQLRKNNGFEVENRINVYYNATDDYVNGISDYIDMIKEETLAVGFEKSDEELEMVDINEYKVGIKLERI